MSGQPVDTLRYAIDGDLAPFRAKAAQVDAEASRLGDSVKAKTAHAFDGATASATKLERQLKITANQYQQFVKESAASGKSVDSLIQAHFRAGSAAEAASKKSVAALAAEQVARRAALNQAKAAAEETARLAAKASPNAIPLRDYQKINLGQQVQDFFISMGSGQNPLTVILQQAPQAASAAGGFSNALKLMGGTAGIARIAVGGLAIGVAATLVTAFVKGQNEAAALERRLALIGGAAGVTRGQIEAMSRSVEGVDRGSAREIMGGLAGGGNTPSGSLVQATQLTRDFARATGSSNAEATAYFNEILAKPAEGARKLVEDFNALSAEQVRLIDDLAASGQAEQAREVIIRRSGEGFSAAAEQVGYLERAAQKGGDALSGLWDRIKGIGRPETPEGELERARGRLAEYAPGGLNAVFGMGSSAAQGWQARVNALETQVAADQTATDQRAAYVQRDRRIRAGLNLLDQYDVEGQRQRTRENAAGAISRAVPDAQIRLDALRLRGAPADEIRAGEANLAQLRRADANAANPNYRPGSGVPAARRQQVDTGARDAQLAEMEVANARALAATPLRDREALRARQQAEAEFTRNSADPRRRGDAASIRGSRLEAFEANQADRRRQVVVAVEEEVTAQQKLAQAYLRSTAAGAAQTTQGQAHAAAIQGLIENEDEYARVLNERAFAQALVNDAQAQQQRALGNQALARLAAANGNPAGLEAARIENDALSQTQAIRDQAQAMVESAKGAEEEAIARERLAAAEMALNAARRQGQETAGLNRTVAANDNNRAANDALELKRKEIELAYANVEVVAQEIAIIRTRQQVESEGLRAGNQDYEDRYAELLKINQEAAKLDLILSGQTDGGRVIDNVRAGLEGIGMAATRGFDSARDAASSFFRQLGDLIVQLYVIKPLLNSLMGTGKGEVGGFIGSLGKGGNGQGGGGFWSSVANAVGSYFGGGRAEGGPVDPGKFYLVGENGPELLGPGVGGNVIPIRPPNSQGVQSSTPSAPQAMTMAFTIDISGANGDAAVAAIARQATAEGVTAALTAYDASLNRSIGAKIQMANRRRIA